LASIQESTLGEPVMKLSAAASIATLLILSFVSVSLLMAQPPRQRPPLGSRDGQLQGTLQSDQQRQRVPDRVQSSLLKALDSNRDGVLSAEEIENAAMALRTLDKNGDGQLEHTEMVPTRRAPAVQPNGQGDSRPPAMDTPDLNAPSARPPRRENSGVSSQTSSPENQFKDKQSQQLSGQPMTLRVIDDTGLTLLRGNKEDVNAIADAFEKAIKEIEEDKKKAASGK
jgi:hypothetical protein